MLSQRSPLPAIVAFFILSGGTFGVWASRIPAVAQYHALSKQDLGLLLLLLAIGALCSFSVSGWAADRFGAKRVCQFTSVIIVLSMIGIGISPNIATLSLAIFWFGAGHGSVDIAMNVWGSDWQTKSGKSIMGFCHAMWSVGGGMGAASGVVAAYFGVNYAIHFAIVAFTLCALALVTSRNRWNLVDPKGAKLQAFQLPKGNLMWVALVGFCASIVEGSITDWSALLLVSLNQATQSQAALGYTAFSVAMVATRLSSHLLLQRYDIVALARFCAVLTTFALLMTISTNILWISLLGFALAGIGVALFFPLIFQRAGNDPVMPSGPAMASVATLGYGGMLLGPPVIGWVADLTSLRISFFSIAFLCLFIVYGAPHLATPNNDNRA